MRPGRNVNDDRDHCDGSDTRARGRRTSGSLTETRVRAWQYWPERFDGSADRNMNPCPLDGTDQLARTVLAAGVEPDGPVDADGDQARVIDAMRATRPSCPVARRHGRGTRPPGRECDGRDAAGARGRGSWPPSPMITAPGVPGVVSMSVPPPPNGVRGATRAMGRPWRRFARADETRQRRPDVDLRASLRQMVTP